MAKGVDFLFAKGKMHTVQEIDMPTKPIQLGENLIIRNLDEKTLITGQARTLLKEGNFTLDAEVIHVKSGPGVKIHSSGNDTLVISCDLTKIEAKIYDMQLEMDKRLKTIEAIFLKIVKDAKK